MSSLKERARHELGHHFVARAMGFGIGFVTAEQPGNNPNAAGGAEIVTNRHLTDIKEVERYCEDRIKVLYAGVLAEALSKGKIDNNRAIGLTKLTGAGDHMIVQQLCNLLRNIRYPDGTTANPQAKMQEDELRLWNEAGELVEGYAAEIEAMADELYQRRETHGKPAKFTQAELDVHPLIKKHFP